MNYKFNPAFFVILLCFWFFSCATANPVLETGTLKGHWVGQVDVMATWCNRGQLNFDILIDEKGRVSGKIGDASITRGHVYKGSSILQSGGNGSYVIRAGLEGFLVRDEKIARDFVSLTFNLVNDTIEGEMDTSGARCGTRDSMHMKVANIILTRSNF